jgi:hypothetical protein
MLFWGTTTLRMHRWPNYSQILFAWHAIALRRPYFIMILIVITTQFRHEFELTSSKGSTDEHIAMCGRNLTDRNTIASQMLGRLWTPARVVNIYCTLLTWNAFLTEQLHVWHVQTKPHSCAGTIKKIPQLRERCHIRFYGTRLPPANRRPCLAVVFEDIVTVDLSQSLINAKTKSESATSKMTKKWTRLYFRFEWPRCMT